MKSLNQYIIEKSRELNIDLCGFTDGQPLEDLRDYLLYREKNNIKTDFEEADIEKRIDPRLTLASCRSIIVLGLSYNVDLSGKTTATDPIEAPDYPLRASLSKSSWGRDYHLVLKEKMEELIQEIKKLTDFQYKYFVDTGPLVDRELAKKAGLGYYGKNCSIINDDYGSYIFLGYILTDLDLEPSREVEEKCGDCRLCLQACPTGALEGDYKLNPKKCISFLTQTKDKIEEGLREKMGIKIYGCDSCQEVCPKNKGVKKSSHRDFLPLVSKGYMNVEELFEMTNREFKDKYGHMAGSWRGKNVLKRNAIIGLANRKEIENINLLIPLLKDPNPMIREYAHWALVNIYLTKISTK